MYASAEDRRATHHRHADSPGQMELDISPAVPASLLHQHHGLPQVIGCDSLVGNSRQI